MKILAYNLVPSNDDVIINARDLLEYIAEYQLNERLYRGIRLEHLARSRGNLRLDFAKFRDTVMPGKATATQLTQPLGLQDDESVSEETAAVFVPNNDLFAMQYNHYGPRRTVIELYINAFSEAYVEERDIDVDGRMQIFQLVPIMQKHILEKFGRFRYIKKIDLHIAPERAPIDPVERGMSVQDRVNRLSSDPRTETVEITLKANRAKNASLDVAQTRDLVRSALAEHGDSVNKIEVSGKPNLDDKTELLTLTDAVLKSIQDIEPDDTRMYPREDRWTVIERAIGEWRRDGQVD